MCVYVCAGNLKFTIPIGNICEECHCDREHSEKVWLEKNNNCGV